MKKEEDQEVLKDVTVREFKDFGRFVTRGIKAGERLTIQSDSMSVDSRTGQMDIDAKAVSLKEVQACLVESPEGGKPPTPYLENLPAGLIEVLAKDIKDRSNPESDVIKN